MEIISRDKRALGAMLATSIGDALGWPNELNAWNQSREQNQTNNFIAWNRKNKNPFWHIETIKAGEYSDDTQLMLAVARSLLTDDWQEYFVKKEYPFWLQYERGAGKAVKKAASLWGKGECPWNRIDSAQEYFSAGGNGGAMRILPHVIKNLDRSIDTILDEVVADVILSHGHPKAILGATCYAYALYTLFTKTDVLAFAELINNVYDGRKKWGGVPNRKVFSEWLSSAQSRAGYSFAEEWNSCYTNMVNMLKYINQALYEGLLADDKKVLESIGAFSPFLGAGDVSVVTAIYFFSKYVNSPELAVSIPAYMIGIDTDTIAAMTGGLVGAFHGSDWIPLEWKSVQDFSYICEITSRLCSSNSRSEKVDDINQMEKIGEDIVESKYSVLHISAFRTAAGQRVYIKSLEKKTEIDSSKEKIDKNTGKMEGLSRETAEAVIQDSLISRITLKKAMEVVLLKYDGIDEEKIGKKTKLAPDVIDKILRAFSCLG